MRRANCQICNQAESQYACPKCEVLYCSVPCYKHHKSHSCSASATAGDASGSGANTARTQAQLQAQMETHVVESPSLCDDTQAAQGGQGKENDRNKKSEGDEVSIVTLPLSSFSPSSQVRQGVEMEMENAESSYLGVNAEVHRNSQPEALAEDVDVEMTQNRNNILAGNQTKMDTGRVGGDALDDPGSKARPPLQPPIPLEPLRKLSSLKWPYVPEAPSYPDPLTRDDPKPLTLAQYEAIARSPAIRRALSSHAHLPKLLSALDVLRGPARERALERALGVAPSQIQSASFSLAGLSPSPSFSATTSNSVSAGERETESVGLQRGIDEEDMKALCELAEAIEAAVRSSAESRFGADPLGLDWDG